MKPFFGLKMTAEIMGRTAHFLFIGTAVFLLMGCHTPLIPKESLNPAGTSRPIVVAEPLSHLVHGSMGRDFKWISRPGQYVPVYEGEGGTFYRGPSDCIEVWFEGKPAVIEDGGIWVSKVNERTVRLYAYEGTRTVYKPDGTVSYFEKEIQNRQVTVQFVGPDKAGHLVAAGAIAGPVITALSRMDPDRILFQTEEFQLSEKLPSK